MVGDLHQRHKQEAQPEAKGAFAASEQATCARSSRAHAPQGGVVVVRNGRAALYDCPEEDGRVRGAPLAFSSGRAIEEGEERTFEEGGVIVYFDHVVHPATEAAAALAAAQPASRPPKAALPLPPSSLKFRAPATLPPRTATAPQVPMREQRALQPSAAEPPPPPFAEPHAAVQCGPSPPCFAVAGRAGQPPAPLLSDAELLAQLEEWGDDPAPQEAAAAPNAAPTAVPVSEEWDDFDAPEAADMELPAEPPSAVAVAQLPSAPAGAFRAPATVARSAAAAAAAVQRPAAARCAEGGALQLRFPTHRETPPVALAVAVPATFPSAAAYSASLVAALGEFLQVQLNCCARAFYDAHAAAGAPRDVAAIKRAAHQGQLSYYAGAELSMRPPSSTAPGGKRARGEAEEEEERSGGASSAPAYFLKLTAAGEREKASVYAKGDVWALSSEVSMDGGPQGWSAVVTSLWHGPNPEGVMAVRLLSLAPSSLTKHRRSLPAFALRCFNATGELDQLQAALDVASCSVARLPCLPLLLRAPLSAAPAAGLDVRCVELQHRYHLNEDQACMVQAAETCALTDAPRALLAQGAAKDGTRCSQPADASRDRAFWVRQDAHPRCAGSSPVRHAGCAALCQTNSGGGFHKRLRRRAALRIVGPWLHGLCARWLAAPHCAARSAVRGGLQKRRQKLG